jgi:hypothetical protein
MKKFRIEILKFTNWITSWHYKIFEFKINAIRKSHENILFTFLLLFICFYEIIESFIIPIILIWWIFK